ncbi:MAG: hydroxymethylbilane synthase [Saprospiraceae bacterium]|nr:hydroxymethylbilane synthase [Saprospiraceae bacterium]
MKIGTRGSDLALWQARFLQSEIRKLGLDSTLSIIKTKGDKIQDLSFDKIEGKGFFTKEIEEALLNHTVDIAVHSMKDLPTEMPQGLVLAAVSYRANPADVLLVNEDKASQNDPLMLRPNATVGTSSSRRKALLIDIRPDLVIKDLRGNVPTRVAKLKSGEYDAIVLAKAGIERLELPLEGVVMRELYPREFVPAPAQGILAFQCREEDREMRKTLLKIHNAEIAECSNVERRVLKLLGGGCHLPLGVFCEKDVVGNYHVHAAYSPNVGEPLRKINISYSTTVGLAEAVFEKLKNNN